MIDLTKTPKKFAGKSFQDPTSEDLVKFHSLSKEDKWKMGYWVEKQATADGFKNGLIIGLLICFASFIYCMSY